MPGDHVKNRGKHAPVLTDDVNRFECPDGNALRSDPRMSRISSIADAARLVAYRYAGNMRAAASSIHFVRDRATTAS
jgi:hypothetical protein